VLTYPKTRFIDALGRVTGDYEDGLHLTAPRPSERFRQLLARIGYCNAIYGLMRADAMRKTGGMADFVGSDVAFQAELVLYGLFWEIPEFLFFRRLHPAASSGMTDAERVTFYNPRAKRRVSLRGWRQLLELARIMSRAPLATSEKVAIGASLIRGSIRRRDEFATELTGAAREFVRLLRT
jgi:hypothetical protein